jgi:nicotinate phosphoribosyltransferase
MIERAAYLGGCDGVAVELAAKRLGISATGTMPHALVLIIGSTGEAALAFDEAVPEDVPRTILIDTFDDEKFGALLAARAIPETIESIRIDTPGNRRGDFRDLIREVRWELDRNGFEHVKIFASGGIDVEYILHLNPIWRRPLQTRQTRRQETPPHPRRRHPQSSTRKLSDPRRRTRPTTTA